MEVLAEIRAHGTGPARHHDHRFCTVENAVRAMQGGAANFVQKPWDTKTSGRRSRRGGMAPRRRRKRPTEAAPLKQRYNFENIVGKSEPMLKTLRPCRPGRQQAVSTVLLQGRKRNRQGDLIAKMLCI